MARPNADLEQFAYAASHDPLEPLRAVKSFLAKRYQGRLDRDADEFIQFAVDGTTRMSRLIQGLLEFSRAGRSPRPPERTDCREALERALQDLSTAIRESGAVVTFDGLPTDHGHPSQLTRVFQNLVGNAIKFRGADRPEVHVPAERLGREWRISVRDNGIAPEHLDRILVIFQRLHGPGEYAGSGIGPAVCKKIIARHGGRIWVESRAGRGSTFRFTLPATPPRPDRE